MKVVWKVVSLIWRVVVRGRIVREPLSMGCYLEEYRARVGRWIVVSCCTGTS